MEVDYCLKWHRLCEAVYRGYRADRMPPLDWADVARKMPNLQIPPGVRQGSDLTAQQLNRLLMGLVQEAVAARIAAGDLGLLDLIDPDRIKHLPPSIYGAEPDPFEGNGFCDNPPEK